MAKIRLHLGNLNLAELIALGQQVLFAMYGNSAFASLERQVAGLLNEINQMIIADEGYSEALQKVQDRLAERRARRATLENLLTEMARGVADISEGNTGLLQSAGFEVPTVTVAPARSPSPEKLPVGMESVSATR